MLRVSAVAFICALFSQSGFAQDVDCANAQDQTSMNDCAAQSYRASDAALNKTYAALGKTVSKAGLAKLKTAQRAWISYRDAQCEFESAGTDDGSVHPMIVSTCLDQLTQAQTERLNQQLNCVEGDLSCGNQ